MQNTIFELTKIESNILFKCYSNIPQVYINEYFTEIILIQALQIILYKMTNILHK